MAIQYHELNGFESPDNVATPGNSNEWFLLEHCNLNVIDGADATIMTFGGNDSVSINQGGIETIYDDGHGLTVAASEAAVPTLVDVFGASWDWTAKFEIGNASGVATPTISSDQHGGSLVIAGNVTFDLKYDSYILPGQFAGLIATHA